MTKKRTRKGGLEGKRRKNKKMREQMSLCAGSHAQKVFQREKKKHLDHQEGERSGSQEGGPNDPWRGKQLEQVADLPAAGSESGMRKKNQENLADFYVCGSYNRARRVG